MKLLFTPEAAGRRRCQRQLARDHCREASQHPTFGIGAHFCMGAPLARQELTVMLESLQRRPSS
ncbi:MAG: hypothetical protein Q8N17_26990 [Burkholderiaceae bacterium]|nr:hypothetical protein [Burkholderiaceae bacterium]